MLPLLLQGANEYCNAKASSLQAEALELLELQRRNKQVNLGGGGRVSLTDMCC